MKLYSSKIRSSLIVLLLFTSLAHAQTDWSKGAINRDAVIRQSAGVTQQAFPNADEVVLDEYIHEAYQPDGSSVLWDDEYIKALTEKGKRGLQSRALYFTLPYSTAEYKTVEIIKPDGSIVPVDIASQGKVMIDPSQMGSNIYNPNDKIFQVTIPGLEINDILHLISFRDTVKARAKDTWSSYEVLEYTSPIRHLVYEVKAPDARPLKNIQLKDPVPGTVSYTVKPDGESRLHRWEVRNVPRMFTEPQMPALHTVVQRLLISTIKDWQEVSTWYWNLSEPHLNAVTPAMRAKVAELVKDAETDDAKIRALFHFVSKEIRYMGITTEKEAPGYEPHDVSLTFENRYGVCRDKAALLVAMLRLAELDAYPVLIMVGPKKDEDVPQPYFNHAIVAVRAKDGAYTLMDPTDENTKELLPAYLCNRSYLVARPQGETLQVSPIIPAENNLVKITSRGSVTQQGTLKMESRLLFEGINDSAYRGFFARRKPEERRKYCEGVIKDVVAGAAITELEILPRDLQDMSQPLTIRAVYEAPDYLITGNDAVMLDPPILGTRVGFFNFVLGQTGLKERKYPLVTEIACGVEETFTLDLGGLAGKPLAMPDYQVIDRPKSSFHMTLEADGGKLVGTGVFKLKGVEYSPAEYQNLKQSLKDLEYEFKKRPIFARSGPESDPDVRILERRTEIRLHAAGEWKARTSVREKVLTYAGKKANAELKLEYNPVWTNVRLVRAAVRDSQGKLHRVADAEMNVMDAPWAGAAPRYPAAKTMVISLPGVEIGSEIDYEIESTQKDRPFFSLQYAFRGFDPVDRETLIIHAPKNLALQVDNRLDGSVRYTRKGDTHVWESRNQAPLRLEDSLPPLWSFTPSVLVSTGDWKTYAAAVQAGLTGAADRQMEAAAKAVALTRGIERTEDKIVAIRDFVAKQIRAAGPAFSELPLANLTPADQTLAQGYGHSADQAVLLFAMFQAIDLAPEFILAAQSSPVPELRQPLLDTPAYAYFNDILVRLRFDRQMVYLNDTDQYAALGSTHFDRCLGMDAHGDPFTISALAPMVSRDRDHYDIQIQANGDARITWTQQFFGPEYAAFHRQFSELPPEERSRYFQELVADLSQNALARGGLITRYAQYPGEQTFTVDVKQFAVRSGRYLYFTIPNPLASVFGLRSDVRENPFYQAGRMDLETRYTLTLPGSTQRIMLLPDDLQLQAPGALGGIHYQSQWDAKKKVLVLTRRLQLEGAVVSPEDYGTLLEIQRTLDHPDTAMVMIEL